MSNVVRRSAIIVPIPVPAALERIRRDAVGVARLGVPAHVTLLVPWLEPTAIDGDDVAMLRRIVAREPAFEVELGSVLAFPPADESPGTVYLAPTPVDPFIRLTNAISAAYPGHPPYGGIHDTIVPHLTIADDAARLEAVRAISRTVLPTRRRVSEAWLIVERDDGRWVRRARLALGRSIAGPARADR